MSKAEELRALESRQLELQAVMASSDAHASKCAKMGLKYRTQYPDEYAVYEAAWTEYNGNESVIETLKAEALAEQEAEAAVELEEG